MCVWIVIGCVLLYGLVVFVSLFSYVSVCVCFYMLRFVCGVVLLYGLHVFVSCVVFACACLMVCFA